MNSEAAELLHRIVEKCGGRDKWVELLNAMRRTFRSMDRAGIADFVRRASRKDDGAVQLAMLAMLGLTLGDVALSESRETNEAHR